MGLIFAQTALFGFFTSYLASSQLMIDDIFGLDSWFPIIFGGSAAVIGLGMLANARLLNTVPLRSLIQRAYVGYGAATLSFAVIAWGTGGTPPFWLFLLGLTPILFSHALRNAVIPLITMFALDIPFIFAGTIYVELLFSWPGMGRLYYQAATGRDYPVLMAVLIIGAVLVFFFNLVADVSYAYLDPRVRYD